ncbi:factor V activator RVV-V alpha-like [Cimex lectularius]|uniref:Peptidase S1 domain-containing protein n=1 Tax=Cimex lectularius TaxID=79782 RepID=A0A8I6RFR7_CIMLE|nr:factor V activator RVV-V alpha-like [Cimex lectularius]
MPLSTLFIIFAFIIPELLGVTDKTYGARSANKGEFPFAVFIYGNLFCGGSLMTMSKVLSAAHCFFLWDRNDRKVYLNIKTAKVIGGTVNYTDRSDGYQERTIKQYSLHRGFQRRQDGSFFHDIATAELSEPFVPSSTLQPMKIVSRNKEEFKKAWEQFVVSGKPCMAMGWGVTDYPNTKGEVPSTVLMVIEVKPWEERRCRETAWKAEDLVTKFGEICASSGKQGEAFCDGDSGSPLVCEGYVYALATANWDCIDITLPQYFLLYWFYLDYFDFNERSYALYGRTGVEFSVIVLSLLLVLNNYV